MGATLVYHRSLALWLSTCQRARRTLRTGAPRYDWQVSWHIKAVHGRARNLEPALLQLVSGRGHEGLAAFRVLTMQRLAWQTDEALLLLEFVVSSVAGPVCA